jgi:molybdopterin-binding protein
MGFLLYGHSFMVTMVAMVTGNVLCEVHAEAEETAEHSASITSDSNQ